MKMIDPPVSVVRPRITGLPSVPTTRRSAEPCRLSWPLERASTSLDATATSSFIFCSHGDGTDGLEELSWPMKFATSKAGGNESSSIVTRPSSADEPGLPINVRLESSCARVPSGYRMQMDFPFTCREKEAGESLANPLTE